MISSFPLQPSPQFPPYPVPKRAGALPKGWFCAVPQEGCPEGCRFVGAHMLHCVICSTKYILSLLGEGYTERACSGLPHKHSRFVGLLFNLSKAPIYPHRGKKTLNNAKIRAAGEFSVRLAQEAAFAGLERIFPLGTAAFDNT